MKLMTSELFFVLLSISIITSCGGGSSSSSGDNNENNNANLPLVDSLPQNNSVAKATSPRLSLSHLAPEGSSYRYTTPCHLSSSRIIIRNTEDIEDTANTQLLDHLLTCSDALTLNSNQTLSIEETSTSSTAKEANVLFTSQSSITPANNLIIVDEEETLALNSIGNLTPLSLLDAVIDQAELSPVVEAVIDSLLNNIANDELPHLLNPLTNFDVVTQTVLYESIDPLGNQAQTLSGFIAFPETNGVNSFAAKDEIILLNHSTDLTPSEKNTTGPWYNLAVVLASRGYLVIVPDNYGLGNTSASTETYLQAKRTGINSVDLVSAVIDSGNYDDVIEGTSNEKNVAIIGYSQGGHSAVAAWQEILHMRQDELNTTQLFTGAGPYNVYETVKGIINYANGTCLLNAYCRYVNDELVNSYAIERILPPLFDYTETGLNEADVINGNQLTSNFVSGFIANNSEYNQLKALLQLNSFTNITNPEVAFTDPTLDVYFYHSDYDRLVAQANTDELTDDLTGYVQSINDESALCNSSNFQLLFANVTEVGVIHGLCAILMIDDVLGRFN
ncbi:MAG: lipase family protein [Cellvibrionaceae bacterium]